MGGYFRILRPEMPDELQRQQRARRAHSGKKVLVTDFECATPVAAQRQAQASCESGCLMKVGCTMGLEGIKQNAMR